MSADLHIHIAGEGIGEREMSVFFANAIGSKYCPLTNLSDNDDENQLQFERMRSLDDVRRRDEYREISTLIMNSPSIWIGRVSWLKAGLTEDLETWVPETVERISALIGEDLPVLDTGLISRIMEAFSLPNKTRYSLAKPEEVRAFLEQHIGQRVFTVSW